VTGSGGFRDLYSIYQAEYNLRHPRPRAAREREVLFFVREIYFRGSLALQHRTPASELREEIQSVDAKIGPRKYFSWTPLNSNGRNPISPTSPQLHRDRNRPSRMVKKFTHARRTKNLCNAQPCVHLTLHAFGVVGQFDVTALPTRSNAKSAGEPPKQRWIGFHDVHFPFPSGLSHTASFPWTVVFSVHPHWPQV
jgi:hypothetical protein